MTQTLLRLLTLVSMTFSLSAAISAEKQEKYPKSFDELELYSDVLLPMNAPIETSKKYDWNSYLAGVSSGLVDVTPDRSKVKAKLIAIEQGKSASFRVYREYKDGTVYYQGRTRQNYQMDAIDVKIGLHNPKDLEGIVFRCPIPSKFKFDKFAFPKESHRRQNREHHVLDYFCDGTLLVRPTEVFDEFVNGSEESFKLTPHWDMLISEDHVYQEEKWCPHNSQPVKVGQNVKFERSEGQLRHGRVKGPICLGDKLQYYFVDRVTERVKKDGVTVYAEADCSCKSSALVRSRDGSLRCNLPRHLNRDLCTELTEWSHWCSFSPGTIQCKVTPDELVSVDDIPDKDKEADKYWYSLPTAGYKPNTAWYFGYPPSTGQR